MVLKRKSTFLITIYILCILAFQIDLYGNELNTVQQFSENLEKLRNINSDLSTQNILLAALIVNNPNFGENSELVFLTRHLSAISSLSGVYIIQLNTFDTVIEKRTGQKSLRIPKRSTDYCCWKNISLVHMTVSYNTQETLEDEAIQDLDFQSPQILHQVKSTLEKLSLCLRYFGDYFANRE